MQLTSPHSAPLSEAKNYFDKLNNDHEAAALRCERYSRRLEDINPKDYTEWTGSLDATSCLGATFWDNRGTVITIHIDGRPMDKLTPLFKQYGPKDSLVLELTGGTLGVRDPQKPSYTWDAVSKTTRENFSKILRFAQRLPCEVKLRSWTLGFSSSKDDLVTDYLAHPDGRLVTFKPGTLFKTCEIPNAALRFTYVSMVHDEGYHTMQIHGNSETMPLRERPKVLDRRAHQNFANKIVGLWEDHQALLRDCSTTPELEQEHFVPLVKDYAGLVLTPPANEVPIKSYRPKNDPVIALQGEAILLSNSLEQ